MTRETFQLAGDTAEVYEAQKVAAIFRPLALATLEAVPIHASDRVLDLACGTGIVARTIRERLGPAVEIAGADHSAAMIAIARRLTADDPGGIEWQVADAGNLPFADRRFTLVLCQQGFQFFPDEATALAEARRVLAPGGRLVLTIWSGANDFFRAMADAITRHVDPALGARSLAPFAFARHRELLAALEAASFADVSSRKLTIERVVASPETSVEREILGSPVGPAVAAKGPEVMRAIVAEIIEACAANRSGDALVFPQHTHLITARAA